MITPHHNHIGFQVMEICKSFPEMTQMIGYFGIKHPLVWTCHIRHGIILNEYLMSYLLLLVSSYISFQPSDNLSSNISFNNKRHTPQAILLLCLVREFFPLCFVFFFTVYNPFIKVSDDAHSKPLSLFKNSKLVNILCLHLWRWLCSSI